MTPLYPFHTPSKSLADRIYAAEFDDALVDQTAWKNVRYEGSKIKTKEINKFTPPQTASAAQTGVGFASIVMQGPGVGEMTVGPNGGVASTTNILSNPGSTIENGFIIEGYTAAGTGMGQSTFTAGGYFADPESADPTPTGLPGIFAVENFNPSIVYEGDSENPLGLIPNLKNETTALYIASTVKGGTEDPQFATIKNHSYLSIDQILLINPRTDELQIIEKQAENFTPFHTFITNDLPTGGNFSVRLIEEFVANNLKGPNQYKVKMNKGWLLKSFDFHFDKNAPQLTENNSMYLYKSGSVTDNIVQEGIISTPASVLNNNRIRFRYGTIELLAENFTMPGPVYHGHTFERERIGPSFKASSIIENKFTQQYYSGSYGLINEPPQPQGTANTDIIKTSGLGSASRFIGLDTLNFLRTNNLDTTLTEQERTELHITFFQGTKDFAPGFNDERSIGTFEVDKNQEQLDPGGVCHDFLPKTHEIIFKGNGDSRFEPTFTTYTDSFISGYVTSSTTINNGCVGINQHTPVLASTALQLGLNVDETDSAHVYLQGGAVGQVGFIEYQSSSLASGAPNTQYGRSNLTHEDGPLFGSPSASDNLYSGSFQYQLSWLDKDHVIITNLNKDAELFDGIGSKGVVILPEHIHPKIKNNINFYLQQAGLGGGNAPNTFTQLDSDSK